MNVIYCNTVANSEWSGSTIQIRHAVREVNRMDLSLSCKSIENNNTWKSINKNVPLCCGDSSIKISIYTCGGQCNFVFFLFLFCLVEHFCAPYSEKNAVIGWAAPSTGPSAFEWSDQGSASNCKY